MNLSYCRLDASYDQGSYGRLVNDCHRSPNAVMKVIVDNLGSPHLCLFAVNDILGGQEIRYNYGKGVNFPWRVRNCTMYTFNLRCTMIIILNSLAVCFSDKMLLMAITRIYFSVEAKPQDLTFLLQTIRKLFL